ncbi:MAG TPA: hypothetical protein DCQ98_09870 [Planctomycetaceae bacterium]|nr:hypothetical protein [Planctomycetaceae bacterium]
MGCLVMKRLAVLGVVMACGLALAGPAFAQPGGGRGQGGPGGFGGMGMGMGGMGGGGLATLLNFETVQKEIGLEEDQLTQVTEAREAINEKRPEFDFRSMQDLSEDERAEKMEEFRESMQKLADEMNEKIEEILLPNQLERLQQIEVQFMGSRAVTNERVKKELEISESQQEKIDEIFEEQATKMREMFGQGGRGGRGQGGPGGQGGGRGQGGPGGNFEEMRTKMEELNKATDEQIMDVLSSSQRDKLEDLKGDEFDVASLRRGPGGRGQGGPGGRGQGGPGGGRGQRPQGDDGGNDRA